MKLRFWPTLLIALGLYFALGIGGSAISNWLYYCPGAGTVSAFLKNYSPQSTLDAFSSKHFNSQISGDIGAGAGRQFVQNTRSIEPEFAMDSGRRADLMNALREDMAEQLQANRAEILNESGDAVRGFHFSYRIGQNVGSATIEPFATSSRVVQRTPLPGGVTEVSGRIAIDEKWFPNEDKAVQVSLNLR